MLGTQVSRPGLTASPVAFPQAARIVGRPYGWVESGHHPGRDDPGE
ncbi:hypothetical protein THTE_0065 [Thermogutta terrifontis]|uniref:Uncharacterized protein n=1 Tax=Thermogutta terrifontis TaxID=1331910 RepID=A0A286R9P7_9BACT|nr:hypothetical protein THTE_0065 [Thermogutta terrifontis]